MTKKLIIEIFIFIVIVFLIESSTLYFVSNLKTKDKFKDPFLQYKSWDVKQKIYYKIFLKVIKKDAPYKKDDEIDFLATMLVTSSKYIPYFAGLIYTESLRPARIKWKHNKKIIRKPLRRWYNFTDYYDNGSPSYGYMKIKLNTINSVRTRVFGLPKIHSWQINIHNKEQMQELFKYAGYHFDWLVETFHNKLDAIAAYKFGYSRYRKWKRKSSYKRSQPFRIIGEVMKKVIEYQEMFNNFSLRGDIE